MDVATDRRASATEIREADRSRASGPPSSSEHMDVRTARPIGEERPYPLACRLYVHPTSEHRAWICRGFA